MKPIITYYNGFSFRSRLEARWAVFFDELGIRYDYEPQGFESDKHDKYLPDFFLPDVFLRDYSKGVFLEIKYKEYPDNDIRQSYWFMDNLVLFKSDPFDNIWSGDLGGFQLSVRGGNEGGDWDECMMFWTCKNCKSVKIEYYGDSYDWCKKCNQYGHCNHTFLKYAAEKARQADFKYIEQESRFSQPPRGFI